MNPFGGVRSTEQENFAIRTSLNLTVTPRQGNCGGRFSSLDGRNGYNKLLKIFCWDFDLSTTFSWPLIVSKKSCNAENDAGKVLDAYTRVAPANYCNGQDSKRCKAELLTYHPYSWNTLENFFKAPFSEMDQHSQIPEKYHCSYNLKQKRLSLFQRPQHDC